MFDDCIIMAGGSGTRLWPASTSSQPKQFLSMPQGSSAERGQTFFGAALRRALAVTGDAADGRVIIAAGKKHTRAIVQECSQLSAAELKRLTLIPEPCAKNTAAAIACALQYIATAKSGRKRNILVLTSDHIIEPLQAFQTGAAAAAETARTDKLVVFGIPPQRPETGYGYIETAEPLPRAEGSGHPAELFAVASFREKPDQKTAEQFIAAKNFFWNSGMFAFSCGFMLDEFCRSAPEVIAPFSELQAPGEDSYKTSEGLKVLENWAGLEQAYNAAKAISFDYAIAEKCASTAMVKAGFSWTDVGSWDEYSRLASYTDAEVYGGGRDNCFVDSDIPVALCAVEDLIVVVRSGRDGSPPAVLISKKGETQRVKEIVEEIKFAEKLHLL